MRTARLRPEEDARWGLQRYAAKGIDTYHGEARFIGRDRLAVGAETLPFRHVLLACGAEPVPLGIPGEQHLVTNEGFLAMEQLPRRIVLVGGSYIAAEFSHIAVRAGSHVVILQQGERMLKGFYADLVGWLMEKFAALGIEVHTGTKVGSIDKTPTGYTVHADTAGTGAALDADLVVHAAGRAPALAALDLAAAGIDVERGRLSHGCVRHRLHVVGRAAVLARSSRGPREAEGCASDETT